MKRKYLWKKIAYISAAVVMAMTTPAVTAWSGMVTAAEESAVQGGKETESEIKKAAAEAAQPAPAPVETQPSPAPVETQPAPAPVETQPAPAPTEAPQPTPIPTEAPQPTETSQPTETTSPDTTPETEQPTSEQQSPSQSESESDGSEQEPTESDTPVITEPETEPSSSTESESESGSESESQSDSETESESQNGSETESESQSGSETESESQSDSETESETVSESETEFEDHSILNANWKTNIIASNASYLGQLSSAYGISIADGFGSVMDAVEQQFAKKLTDPDNFRVTNWKEVFAVYIYELKKQTGAANVSADSQALLLDVLTKMNAPELALGIAPEAVEIEEVFVDEYPIEDELEKVDEQQELLTDIWMDMPGNMGDFAKNLIEEEAEKARQAQYDRQQAEMEQARYEKWLRIRQEQEIQASKKLESYSTADITPRTIADYVEMNGLGAAAQAEIEKYASTECLQLCAIASAAPQIVRASVGNEISEERVRIVTAAYSLVGKVGYFWGGKSSAIGWDPAWGTPAKVTAAGSTSSGMTRSYGLDCSGYVQYCYRNGLGGSDCGIGGHTTSQWNASVMVDQVNVKPGDLVFYGGPERGDVNHVGVVVGKSTDGGLIVAHCSSSRNGVVVGEAWTSGFRYVRTVTSLN